MKMKKLLPCLMAFAAMPALAGGADAVAKRVGPVSYYGALGTSGGKIIGQKNSQEAVVRGMSWFWSDATGLPYYSKTVLNWAVENLKIDVIRFAMGITSYKETTGAADMMSTGYSYSSAPDGYKAIVDQMVEAAVENDIYIILDWHSHRAQSEQAIAKEFFEWAAAKYANVPNVIFEIYNEPLCDWGTITGYAGAVIPGIRKSSQNLVLVGTPSWSQLTQYGGVAGGNIGYVFHFYAGTHTTGSYSGRITSAKGSGSPVFITEWGTVNADGAGSANEGSTNSWFTFMDNNNISSCNWSLRQSNGTETSAMFDGSTELTSKSLLDNAKYTASGTIVKNYLAKHARAWNDSLTKGKRTGSCAFKHTTALETDGAIANALPAGCTYTSSNENVVAIDGSNLKINGAGYSMLTGNDGTQTIVTISPVPKQTVPNFLNLNCNYSGSCSTNRTLDYSGSGYKEWIVTVDQKTKEGSSFTLTSLDPSVIEVTTATCTNAACSNSQTGKKVLMYRFKQYGSAQIVAQAAAIPGYSAVNDTITVTYNKAANKMTSFFKNTKIALGGTAEKIVPDTTAYKTPVTFTFNGQPTSPYVTKSGSSLVAGTQNAIVVVTASAPETDNYLEFSKSINVIIGDSASAVNLGEFIEAPIVQTNMDLPLHASVYNNQLNVGSEMGSDVKVDLFSVTGQKVISKTLKSGNASMSLAGVPNGSYLIIIKQGSRQLNVQWNKK